MPLPLAIVALVVAAMAALPSTARADTFWDVSPTAADALEAALERGDVLAHLCPGCGGQVVVFRLRGLERAPGTDSDGHQLAMRWRGLGTGIVGEAVEMPALACAPPEQICLADPTRECAGRSAFLDVPYTFVLRGSEWIWVGALAGLQPPGPNWEQPLPATRAHRRLAPSCAQQRPATSRPRARRRGGPHGRGPGPRRPRR